jgi:rhodanese-related sulfurtransferase
MSEAEKMKRRNEVFRRINCRSLARWINLSGPDESIYNLGKTNDENMDTTNVPGAQANVKQFSQYGGDIYTSQSVQTSDNFMPKPSSNIMGAPTNTILGMESSSKSLYNAQKNATFILFDLRQPSEYCEFRIRDSISFHSRLINQDKFPSEIYAFKNRPNKWIVVYDVDDKYSEPWADLLVKKGFQNVMMLTGGIAKFCTRFPDLVEGVVPSEFLFEAEKEYPIRETENSVQNSTKKVSKSKNTFSVSTMKTGVLKRSKLPKKDLLMRQHRLNQEIQKQRISNPKSRNFEKLSNKPCQHKIMKGETAMFQERKLNFKKKNLTSKIK